MTRAGAGNLAFGKTNSFLGSLTQDGSGNDEYFEPGIDPQFNDDPELDRDLTQVRLPNEVFHNTSIEGNIEGAFGIDFAPENARIDDVHDILFNNHTGTGDLITTGESPSSRWFVGLDYIRGKAERVLKGCVPINFEFNWEQGGVPRYSCQFIYADEAYNTSFSPADVGEVGTDVVAFHSTDLQIDGTAQSKEQSFSLSIEDMSAFHYGADSVAEGATVAGPRASLDVTTIITEDDQLELAYGGSGQTTTSNLMDAVSGTLTLNTDAGEAAKYNLSSMKPENHTWQDIINADADAAESYTMQVNGVSMA